MTGAALFALVLYLVYTLAGIETLSFGVFIPFKSVFPSLLGAVTARYAAMNNFRFR